MSKCPFHVNLSLAKYLRLAERTSLIPVSMDIPCDLETPITTFHKLGLSQDPYAFLLESVAGGAQVSRYSLLGGRPFMVVSGVGRCTRVREFAPSPKEYVETRDPLDVIQGILDSYHDAFPPVGPFSGGAVGYLSYEYANNLERISDRAKGSGLPEAFFIFPRLIVVFDHAFHTLKLILNSFPGSDPESSYQAAVSQMRSFVLAIRQKDSLTGLLLSNPDTQAGRLPVSSMSKSDFKSAVERIKSHIVRGDVFQAVISQQFRIPLDFDPLSLYRILKSMNPSPYTFFFRVPDTTLVGASPEVMVRVRERTAMLRPIAGTKPRAKDEVADRRLAAELLRDEKELAEHMMLVDLGRNDLGRICQYSSVKVTELRKIERYSHVMHIVSQIEGELNPQAAVSDVIRATFPAGTVSGAPKIRAMQLIDAVEPVARGPYAGLVGYMGFDGNLDSCIMIRTVVIAQGEARLQAGAGIVADSDPESEYTETLNKAAAMLKAVEKARALRMTQAAEPPIRQEVIS